VLLALLSQNLVYTNAANNVGYNKTYAVTYGIVTISKGCHVCTW